MSYDCPYHRLGNLVLGLSFDHRADPTAMAAVSGAFANADAAGCHEGPILILEPNALSSERATASPRFIGGRRLDGIYFIILSPKPSRSSSVRAISSAAAAWTVGVAIPKP